MVFVPDEKAIPLPTQNGSLEAVGHHVGQAIIEVAAVFAALVREGIQEVPCVQTGARAEFQDDDVRWQRIADFAQRREGQGRRVFRKAPGVVHQVGHVVANKGDHPGAIPIGIRKAPFQAFAQRAEAFDLGRFGGDAAKGSERRSSCRAGQPAQDLLRRRRRRRGFRRGGHRARIMRRRRFLARRADRFAAPDCLAKAA